MSTLSQTTGSSSYIGEILTSNSSILGTNPIINNREFLQSGYVKRVAGNSAYVTPASLLKTIAYHDANTSASWSANIHPSWAMRRYWQYDANFNGNFTATRSFLFFVGGNWHHCISYSAPWIGVTPSGTFVYGKYGSSLTSAPTTDSLSITNSAEWSVYDFILFKGRIIFCRQYTASGYPNYVPLEIYSSTGTGFSLNFTDSNTFSSVFGPPYTFVANNDTCILAPFRNGDNLPIANTFYRTTDGVNWTPFSSTSVASWATKLTWSPAANTILMISGSGAYTTANGSTYVLRQTLPMSDQTNTYDSKARVAHSNTSTIFSLGSSDINSNYLARTANGLGYNMINLANTPELVGVFTGSSGSVSAHPIYYDNANYIIVNISTGACAVSSDDGNTWSLQQRVLPITSIINPVSNTAQTNTHFFANSAFTYANTNSNNVVQFMSISRANSNGRTFLVANSGAQGNANLAFFDFTDKFTDTSPDWMGTVRAFDFPSGTTNSNTSNTVTSFTPLRLDGFIRIR